MKDIIGWINNYKKRRLTRKIRKEMGLMGFCLIDLSDEDIEKGCVRLSKIAGSVGVLAKDAVRNLDACRRAFNG